MTISRAAFGRVDGRDADLFTLANDRGMVVKLTTYGGIVTSLVMPDRDGRRADIVCGFDSLAGYLSAAYRANAPYFGCLVGRYAGRIKDGRFPLGGGTRQLACNDGPNHLHGGVKGFDRCVWAAEPATDAGDAVLTLSRLSPDGEEGYPGNVAVSVEHRLTDRNELRIRYRATTDRATPLALTNHTYFNLNGFTDRILDHVVRIAADRFLVPDETNVPVGAEAAVAGTACDFNAPRRLGDAFGAMPEGFEHYYVFARPAGTLEPVATVREPAGGRTLDVLTTEPGALFYTGRYTSDALRREDGTRFGRFRAFCLETAKPPNGPNLPVPQGILHPGQIYDETTVYRFGWS
jgi:aldose 1-epimerase